MGVEPGDNVGGREVGGDDEVGSKPAKGTDEGAGQEVFEGLRDAAARGSIGKFVNNAEEGRGVVDQIEVNVGVDATQEGGGVLEKVPVLDGAAVFDGGMFLEVFEEGVGGAQMAGAGGGGEDQDAFARGAG